MKLPETINRKAVRSNFDKLSFATWDYLFDYEKENGLAECRVPPEWGIRPAWYSVAAVRAWLINHGHYTHSDFDEQGWPISRSVRVPRGLKVTTHILA